MDEFANISEHDILAEEKARTTVIKFRGYTMVGNSENLKAIDKGYRDQWFDKCAMFDSRKISEMKFSPGAHECDPQGNVKYNSTDYDLWHFQYLTPEYTQNRTNQYKSRLSEKNIRNNWGSHYLNDLATQHEALLASDKLEPICTDL